MTWHTFEIVLCLIVAFGCVQINATDNATEVCENVPASLPFVRHPRGCNSYYVCWNGVVYVRDCPDGFMFDASGICEYPRNVDCNQCSPHGQTIIRVFDTCDQFIKCSNGESTRMQCAAGLYFDTNTLTCRQQNEVECVPAPITTTTPATQATTTTSSTTTTAPDMTTTTASNTTPSPTTTTTTTAVTTPMTTTTLAPTTTIDGTLTTLDDTLTTLSDTLTTTDDTLTTLGDTLTTLGDTLTTTDETLTTLDDTLTTLGDTLTTTDETLTTLVDTLTTIDDTSTTIEETTEAPVTTKAPITGTIDGPCNGTWNIYMAHQSECNRYYFCFMNRTWERKCPTGLHWNQLANACDLVDRAHCIHNLL